MSFLDEWWRAAAELTETLIIVAFALAAFVVAAELLLLAPGWVGLLAGVVAFILTLSFFLAWVRQITDGL